MGFLNVNISKTARGTHPQNFTMLFTCLKLEKNGFLSLEKFFNLGWILAEPTVLKEPSIHTKLL